MGCDIHGFVEVKPFPDSDPTYWKGVIKIDEPIDRNYKMFSYLFGVRKKDDNSPKGIAEKRGLPIEGYSTEVLSESGRWGTDGHSHTWIVFEELTPIYSALNDDWKRLVSMMRYLKSRYGSGNCRIVVWFDN